MIKKVKFNEFVLVDGKHSVEVLNNMKNSSKDNWLQSSNGYYRILDVEENTSDLGDSVITIETWDIKEFTPYHALGYSMMNSQLELLKKMYNK